MKTNKQTGNPLFILAFSLVLIALLASACASTGGGGGGISLMEAIVQSAEKIAAELPPGGRAAIAAFESPNDGLSDYIIEELTGALLDRGMEVADQQNIEYVFRELNLRKSEGVSDENAQSIGKFLGAQLVITGQLTDAGASYRFRISAIDVEGEAGAGALSYDVRSDRAMQDMIADFAGRTAAVKTAHVINETAVPQTAGAFLDRGILFASRANYETAIADFTEALNIDANLNAAYMLRGRAFYASASMVITVGDNFSSVGTLSTGGQATADQSRIYDQAIADFTQAVQLDPDNAAIYRERGNAYASKGSFDQALADFDHAIRLNPNYARAYSNRGVTYVDIGDIDRAITDYDQAIRLDPNYAVAYNNRGSAYVTKGDLGRAIADCNQAIRLDPNYPLSYNNRGNAYFDMGDIDRAITDYDQALRLNPNYVGALINRGNAYYSKHDYDRAIVDYDQAIRLNPNDADAYNNRGNAYYNKRGYDKAIADYEAALRINPNHANAKTWLENARKAR